MVKLLAEKGKVLLQGTKRDAKEDEAVQDETPRSSEGDVPVGDTDDSDCDKKSEGVEQEEEEE